MGSADLSGRWIIAGGALIGLIGGLILWAAVRGELRSQAELEAKIAGLEIQASMAACQAHMGVSSGAFESEDQLRHWLIGEPGFSYRQAIRRFRGPALVYWAPNEVFVLYFDKNQKLVDIARAHRE
jgi:hypothetical protein